MFVDPAFGPLAGSDIGRMWRALTKGSKNLRLEVTHGPSAEGLHTVNWVARYDFGKASRPVENHVTSRIVVRDGLIVAQVDSFDFHTWAKQALGLAGLLAGWTRLLQRKVQADARKRCGITSPLPPG
jgi:hypothetical protein